MNYEQISDSEINKAVAKCEGIDVARCGLGGSRLVTTSKRDFMRYIDYCNSWADMGPLIKNVGISLIEYSDDLWIAVLHNTFSAKNCLDSRISFDYTATHESPLRAATIVYLMSNGG